MFSGEDRDPPRLDVYSRVVKVGTAYVFDPKSLTYAQLMGLYKQYDGIDFEPLDDHACWSKAPTAELVSSMHVYDSMTISRMRRGSLLSLVGVVPCVYESVLARGEPLKLRNLLPNCGQSVLLQSLTATQSCTLRSTVIKC